MPDETLTIIADRVATKLRATEVGKRLQDGMTDQESLSDLQMLLRLAFRRGWRARGAIEGDCSDD